MEKTERNRRLSSLDAFFLYHERRESPFNIGGVSLFAGEIEVDRLLRTLERRIELVPRYRERLVSDPLNLAHPVWEESPGFDLRQHLRTVRLPETVTDDELGRLAGEIMSQRLDRTRPLWDLTVVPGLAGGRTAIIPRIHHCMVDGVGGVELMKILLDLNPEGSPVAAMGDEPEEVPQEPLEPPAEREWPRRLFDAALGGMLEVMERIVDLNEGLVDLARMILDEDGRRMAGELGARLPGLAVPVEPLPFNLPLSGERRFEWLELPLAEVLAIRGTLRGSLNDVVLTLLGMTVAGLLRESGHGLEGRRIRVMVPVNVRRQSNQERRNGPGNQISFLPVVLPLDEENPGDLFRQINRQTTLMKQGRMAELINLFISGYGTLPAPLQSIAGATTPDHVPPFNLISTNVPGPPVPLFAAGRRLLAHYPYVPIAYAIGFGLATLSYDQRLCLGLTSDRAAFPMAGRMRELLVDSFNRLRQAAGVDTGQC
jgi:diacylglycerol O-acyltransferase